MNIHFLIDNIYTNKFIEFMKKNKLDESTVFIIIVFGKVRYSNKLAEYDNVTIIESSGQIEFFKHNYKCLKKYFDCSNKIYVHCLTDILCKLLFLNTSCEVYWMLWGVDFYSVLDIQMYDQKTKNILSKCQQKTKKSFIRSYINSAIKKKVIRNINYICSWNYYDYKLIKDKLKSKGEYLNFYYPIDIKLESNLVIRKMEQYNYKNKFKYIIQVGNSADCTNNHIEILQFLAKFKNDSFGVIVPLSYGNNQKYTEEIVNLGESLFGDRFIPMLEYLEYDIYNYILSQVDVAIMNHNRQQGVGNIIYLLNLGKKVYVKENITTFNSFKDKSINLFGINEDLFTCDSFEQIVEYNTSDKNKNIEQVYSNFNNDLCKKQIEIIISNKN